MDSMPGFAWILRLEASGAFLIMESCQGFGFTNGWAGEIMESEVVKRKEVDLIPFGSNCLPE